MTSTSAENLTESDRLLFPSTAVPRFLRPKRTSWYELNPEQYYKEVRNLKRASQSGVGGDRSGGPLNRFSGWPAHRCVREEQSVQKTGRKEAEQETRPSSIWSSSSSPVLVSIYAHYNRAVEPQKVRAEARGWSRGASKLLLTLSNFTSGTTSILSSPTARSSSATASALEEKICTRR